MITTVSVVETIVKSAASGRTEPVESQTSVE